MNIRFATEKDISKLYLYDKHISQEELKNSIWLKRVLVAEENEEFIGWLRYNLFWDNIPFINMLYLLEDKRNKGYGKILVNYWESEMKSLNYNTTMVSTQSNEYSQHFGHVCNLVKDNYISNPNSKILINRPITISCICSVFE